MHSVIFSTDLFGLLAGPWSLHTYGLLIALGFLLGMNLTKRQAERERESGERIIDLSFYLLLAGLVGARIVFILTKLDDYLRSPAEIFFFWRGGLVWYGGFIGAALYMWVACRKAHLSYFKFVDLFIPNMALAHAFGRLGCLAAGCCFGKPVDLPWAVVFPAGSMAQQSQVADGLVGFDDPSLSVHPTQLYEAGAEMALFWLLLTLRPFKRFHGQLFLTWLAIYPLVRSAIEVFRGDRERGVYVLSTSQYISILVGLAAIAVYVHLRRVRKQNVAKAAA